MQSTANFVPKRNIFIYLISFILLFFHFMNGMEIRKMTSTVHTWRHDEFNEHNHFSKLMISSTAVCKVKQTQTHTHERKRERERKTATCTLSIFSHSDRSHMNACEFEIFRFVARVKRMAKTYQKFGKNVTMEWGETCVWYWRQIWHPMCHGERWA